ncbi:MAG: hypothetical protein DRG63_13245 [Deltaproteobacteria bacterium]|nr:MAG: hypothetical protein DRG63_13245 [Deltaproteobacteria bacterium]
MGKFKDFIMGPFEDWKENPILSPTGGFQSKAVYNPSVIEQGGEFLMFYRAEAEDGLTGRIAFSKSSDPLHFDAAPEPILVPDQDYDRGGCEDPRVVRFEDTYFLFYVGNSGHYHISNICLAISKNLSDWEKIGRLLEARKDSWCSRQAGLRCYMERKGVNHAQKVSQ